MIIVCNPFIFLIIERNSNLIHISNQAQAMRKWGPLVLRSYFSHNCCFNDLWSWRGVALVCRSSLGIMCLWHMRSASTLTKLINDQTTFVINNNNTADYIYKAAAVYAY